MIRAQGIHKALEWFPERRRDAFCMCDQIDPCLGGLGSSQDASAKPPWEGLGCLYSVLPLSQSMFTWQSARASEKVNWIMLPSCLKAFYNLTGLIKSHVNSSHALIGPAWSALPLYCRPLTRSPTKPGRPGELLFILGPLHRLFIPVCSGFFLFFSNWLPSLIQASCQMPPP